MYPGDPLTIVGSVSFRPNSTNKKQTTFKRKLPLGDIRLRGLLMRVRTISERDPLQLATRR